MSSARLSRISINSSDGPDISSVRFGLSEQKLELPSEPYSFWKDSAFHHDINLWGSLTLLYDGAMELANLSTYFTGWAAVGIFGVPSLFPLVPKVMNIFRKAAPPVEAVEASSEDLKDEIDYAKKHSEKIRQIYEDPTREEEREVVEETMRSIEEFNKEENFENVNVLINAGFLGFRDVRSASILLQMYDLLSQDKNDEIAITINNIYTGATLFFMALVLFHKLYGHSIASSHKQTKVSDAQASFFSRVKNVFCCRPRNQADAKSEESKSDLDEPFLPNPVSP